MDKFIKLKLNIIDSLIMISGIKGFSKHNATNNKNILLVEKHWKDAIIINEILKKLVVDLNIIISFDINATNLCKRIENNISILLKNNGFRVFELNIYIKGVC